MQRLTTSLIALALLAALAPAPLGAQGRLQALDASLGAETLFFASSRWEGHAAVTTFTRITAENEPPALALHVMVLDAQGWRSAAQWALPPETRWVEPLRLPGGVAGWLLLVQAQWQIAVAHGQVLERRPLCPCATIYSHGGSPDGKEHRFVHDVDGDGVDEVLLPYSNHVEAYRIAPHNLAPEPLWRSAWHTDGTPLPRAEKADQGFELPTFTMVDVNGDGQRELFIEGRDNVRIAIPPASDAPAGYGLDAARRALLQRRRGEQALPDTLLEALRRLGDRRFATADELLTTLAQPASAEQRADWAPYLLNVLAMARREVLYVRPYTVPLQGLGEFAEDDRGLLLGRADMDGDGVLDVLHAKLLHYRSVFNQKNELRWYRGHKEGGRIAFAPPSEALKSDSGSFAELFSPRTGDAPPLALLMATTDVSLGTLMRALASQSVTLRASIFPWRDGTLVAQPVSSAQLTYTDLRAEGRRAMFLFADLNGDGWRDYILNVNQAELRVYLSAGGPPSLSAPPLVFPGQPLPSRPERVLVMDLDGDGREELVLRFRTKYQGELGHQLRLLRWEPEAAPAR